jgi:hypothetical protein
VIVGEGACDAGQLVALPVPNVNSERLKVTVFSGYGLGGSNNVDGSKAGAHQPELGDRLGSGGT